MVFGVTAQTAVQCEMKPSMLRIATRSLLTDLPTPRQIFATDFALRKGLRGNFTLSLMPNVLANIGDAALGKAQQYRLFDTTP